MRARLRPASSSETTTRRATRSWNVYRGGRPGGGTTRPIRCHDLSCESEQPVNRAACAAVKSMAWGGSGLVVAAPALTPAAPGVAEHVLERPGPHRAGEVVEPGLPQLADVP